MKQLDQEALVMHEHLKGKITIEPAVAVDSMDQLSLVYSPGVAAPCRVIAADKERCRDYTWKGKTIAVVSNGTAVLGLGDIGPEAALPVMEGKALLFRQFGGINAVPLVIDAKTSEEVIAFCKAIAPSFGGINLEDIKAPECVEIEEALIASLDIPVFHDDQHGTAIVSLAALLNALKVTGRQLGQLKIVVSGAGAAGSAIIRLLHEVHAGSLIALNSKGAIDPRTPDRYNAVVQAMCPYLSVPNGKTLAEVIVGADVFIGVSKADLLQAQDVRAMAADAIVFAMANPDPEIAYPLAKQAGAAVVGTGRSDYPNQVNNVLAFPGIFQGVLSAGARKITRKMQLAAAYALAACVLPEELNAEHILPDVFQEGVAQAVASAVGACVDDHA